MKTGKEIYHTPPHFACPNCHAILNSPEFIAKGWLCRQDSLCRYCNSSLDGWQLILDTVSENHMLTQALIPFGAHTSFFKIIMRPKEIFSLIFADFGVPDTAKILSVNYTANSGEDEFIVPLEMHGNQPLRHFIPNELSLYPAVLGAKSFGKETNIQVYVVWVPDNSEDIFWSNLLEACEHYVSKKFTNSIVPANVAVEARLTRFLYAYLSNTASKNRVDDFLKNGATYSHQLNVLLPLVVQMIGFPEMPETLRGELNRLRSLRNEIAHKGHLDKPITAHEAARFLCAALFGYYYIELLQEVSPHTKA